MKEGTKHWWMLRMASLPLVPLFFYFLTQLDYITTTSRTEFINWLRQPVASGCLTFFIICAFYHASLGMDEIIEDYVSPEGGKAALMRINKIFFSVLGVACLYVMMELA